MKEAKTTLSRARQIIGIVIAILVCFSAAGLGGMATTAGLKDWYPALEKPAWNPPDWIFGPVWTVLYLMMAISVWMIWRQVGFERGKKPLLIFAVQLVLNTFWSLLFFGMRQPGWAFAEIILLWLAIGLTIALFAKHSKPAAILMMPYWMWVSFAAVLNYTIWSMN